MSLPPDRREDKLHEDTKSRTAQNVDVMPLSFLLGEFMTEIFLLPLSSVSFGSLGLALLFVALFSSCSLFSLFIRFLFSLSKRLFPLLSVFLFAVFLPKVKLLLSVVSLHLSFLFSRFLLGSFSLRVHGEDYEATESSAGLRPRKSPPNGPPQRSVPTLNTGSSSLNPFCVEFRTNAPIISV